MAKPLEFNKQFARKVLTYDARRIVEDRTRAIHSGAANAAGGKVRMFTDFGVTRSGQRYRGAVVCINRDPDIQAAGQRALVARLKASA